MAQQAFLLLFTNHDYKRYMHNIISLIGISKRKEEQIEKEVRYFIFGAGIAGKKALSSITAEGGTCIGFIDNNEKLIGNEIDSYRVFSPKEAFNLINEKTNVILVVAADIPRFLKEMYSQAYQNIIEKERIYIYNCDEFHSSDIDCSKLLSLEE